LAVYSYRATTIEGAIVEGNIEASDEGSALERIKDTGVIPLKVTSPRKGLKKGISLRSSKGDLLTFTAELSALIGAGLPLDRRLTILAGVAEGRQMQDVVTSVLKLIREGSSFSDALRNHPKVFPRLYVNMVRAGETGGVLDIVLEKLGEFLETAKELKDNVYSAMIYPVILGVTGSISIIILLTFVIPRFSILFKEMGGSLPASTQMILCFSAFLRDFWWILLPAGACGTFALWRFVRTERGVVVWDGLKFRFLRDVVSKLETARFCRTMGTLIKSGVPFLQALQNSKDVVGNRVVASAIAAVAKDVKEGKGIAVPLSEAKVFPQLALSMIKVGEETGQLDAMLLKVATTYEKSLKDSVKRFMGLLEPAIILTMGLVIAFIVVSMLVAIFGILELPF
jgi:general secretion pathway protein F